MENGDVLSGYKMTELGVLPEEWRALKLEGAVLKAKSADPRRNPERPFEYVDVSSVSRETLRINGTTSYMGRDAPSRARKPMKTGDVLFATVRPSLRRVAMVPASLDGQICSTAFCVVRSNPSVADSSFLFFALSSDRFVRRVSEHQRGSSYPAVSDTDVLTEPIPLPPVTEQKQIAAVLSAVQDAKETTSAVVEALKSLKKSLVKHLFTYGPVSLEEAEKVPLKETEIGNMPSTWEIVRLGDFAEVVSGGTPSRASDEYWGGNIRWVKTGEINYRVINDTEERISTAGLENSSARLVQAGTLLMAMYGAGVTRGRVAILGVNAAINQACAAFLLPPNTPPEFLFHYFSYNYERIRNLGHGAHQKNLSAAIIKSIGVPIPPLTVQRQIASLLSAVDEKIQAEESRFQALNELFKTLLENLMTAKIRVNSAPEVSA